MNRSEKQRLNFEPWRIRTIIIIGVAIFIFYVVRLFSLQIVQGEKYQDMATANRTATIREPATRGIIYDRNDYILARNIASYNVVITPADLPEDEGSRQQIYRQVSEMIGVPVNKGNTDETTVKNYSSCSSDLGITQVVYIGETNYPYDPIQIKCNVDETTALKVREHSMDWPGVDIEISPIRDYPTGSLTSEIIGFLGPIPADMQEKYEALGFVTRRDKVGYAGIEDYFQDELSGKNGLRVVEQDVAGQIIRDVETPQDPVAGNNIRLTIDTRLQLAAKTALVNEINTWNRILGKTMSTNGVVIAMNPKTGEILAMVSYPTYENNRMARFIPSDYYTQLIKDPTRPLFNHAISAEHPPGSVFKEAAAIGILNEGVVTPDYKVEDPGKITIMQTFYENDPGTPRDYVCWIYKDTNGGHGMVDFLTGVAQSCDVYFYKVGGGFGEEVPNGGLGIYRLAQYARALGYGETTGIELAGETAGLLPEDFPKWKRQTIGENWSSGDTYIATIGQGYVLSTPLQVLVAYATLANDGKMMKPTLVHDILDADGQVIQTLAPTLVRDLTKDPVIAVYDGKQQTGEYKTIAPWVIQKTKEAMRMVVTDGTAASIFEGSTIQSAGKTGTAEYCDNVAQEQKLCEPGNWPAHAWYAGYAPYDDPEIVVVAFVYNGKEGSTVAAPIVRQVLESYFRLKSGGADEQGTVQ
jgi:penicillin-binding protein 2